VTVHDKNTVITFEHYAARERENLKKENVIFCMFDSAHGITHLFVYHRTTDKYTFKVKIFFSQKFLSSTVQTKV
jgi:hypothetical protein